MPMDMLILPVEIQGLQQKHQLQLVPRIPRSVPRAILAKTMLHVTEWIDFGSIAVGELIRVLWWQNR